VDGVERGVSGGGDAGEALHERVGRGVEELVGDAIDAASLHGFQVMPVALLDDAFKGNAIPCSAPTEEEDVGVGGSYGFCAGVGAGLA
jgi:hypothetical protein